MSPRSTVVFTMLISFLIFLIANISTQNAVNNVNSLKKTP